jgi:hypothetical protein
MTKNLIKTFHDGNLSSLEGHVNSWLKGHTNEIVQSIQYSADRGFSVVIWYQIPHKD